MLFLLWHTLPVKLDGLLSSSVGEATSDCSLRTNFLSRFSFFGSTTSLYFLIFSFDFNPFSFSY